MTRIGNKKRRNFKIRGERMKTTFLKSIGGTALALLVLVGGRQISVSGQDDKSLEPSLVGVWLTQVTRRNCDTG